MMSGRPPETRMSTYCSAESSRTTISPPERRYSSAGTPPSGKKKRQKLYTALADVEALAPSKALYEEGLTGMEAEFERYMEAVALLESSGVPRNRLTEEKAEIYEQLAELNREIRTERQKLKLCHEIQNQVPVMEQDIQRTEEHQKEVREHEHNETQSTGQHDEAGLPWG